MFLQTYIESFRIRWKACRITATLAALTETAIIKDGKRETWKRKENTKPGNRNNHEKEIGNNNGN